MSTFEEQFPSLKGHINKWQYSEFFAEDSVFLQEIEQFCLDKQKVREAIIRNYIDDIFRQTLLKELGL